MTTILPDLFARWTREFAAKQPGITLSAVPPYGPPQGRLSLRLAEFLDGRSDFALVSRRLTDDDLARFRRANGTDPVVVPVAAGSWRHFGFVDTVVVIVNGANPVRKLTYAQIATIFAETPPNGSEGREWGKFGAKGWSDRPVRPVGAATWLAEDSARSSVVRERVLHGARWRADLVRSGTEAEGPDLVARHPDAIAITGLGHLPPGVKALAIAEDATGPFVRPDYNSVARGLYPLSRTVDMLVKREPDGTIDPVMAEFIRFILSREGQSVVASQRVFLPFTNRQAARSRAMLGPCPVRTSQAH